MAWKVISPSRGKGGSGRGRNYAVRLSVVIGGAKDSPKRLAISIHEKFLKSLRWKIGDRIDVMEDAASGMIGIERNPEGSRVISFSSKRLSKTQQCGRIQVAMDQSMIDKICGDNPRELSASDIMIDGDIIAIPFLN